MTLRARGGSNQGDKVDTVEVEDDETTPRPPTPPALPPRFRVQVELKHKTDTFPSITLYTKLADITETVVKISSNVVH